MQRLILMICVLALALGLASTAIAQETTGQPTVHVVQPGENLFRISLRYGVSMASIAAANHITNLDLIFAGQRLFIPGASGTTSTGSTGTAAVVTTAGGDIPVSELNWCFEGQQWNDGRCNNPDPWISRWHWLCGWYRAFYEGGLIPSLPNWC